MIHLVVGGTGTVGSEVARQLLARGEEVLVLTRGREKSGILPRGSQGVIGDLREPSSVRDAFTEAERVFLLNAVSPTELQEGLVAVAEARRAGAKKLVYLSVARAEAFPEVPHFAAKFAIERAVASSGIPFTILRPVSFFQNDYWMADAILKKGVYPAPIGGVGCSLVDVRDIADAAVAALTQPGHDGRTYVITGPEAFRGDDCAKVYSEALGRKVRYAGDDLEEYAKRMHGVLPGWMTYDFALMYRRMQQEGLIASAADVADTEAILGRPPRRYRDFVREVVASA